MTDFGYSHPARKRTFELPLNVVFAGGGEWLVLAQSRLLAGLKTATEVSGRGRETGAARKVSRRPDLSSRELTQAFLASSLAAAGKRLRLPNGPENWAR